MKRTNCVTCGKPLTKKQQSRKQKRCSRECYNRDYGARPVEEHVCRGCGRTFKPSGNDRTIYCSRECAFEHIRDWRAKQEPEVERVCGCCGKTFKLVQSESSVFCSDQCKRRGHKRQCTRCGTVFYGEALAFYCSGRCKNNEYLVRARERYVPKPLIDVQCSMCGKQYKTNRPTSRYCSEKCSGKAEELRKRDQNAKRRARRAGAFVQRVVRRSIFQRDGWVCQICGKKVKRNAKAPHPMAPTLDHIIPLARGGTHEPKNVQLAHFICNSRRGADGPAQIRVL